METHVLGGFAAAPLRQTLPLECALTNRKYHSATLLFRLDLYNNVERLLLIDRYAERVDGF